MVAILAADGEKIVGVDEKENKGEQSELETVKSTSSNTATSTLPIENVAAVAQKDGGAENPNPEREGFDNGVEFVLTCLGLAVGLGNIWRFPTRAYENGGSAFLIPYITCALCFGLPVVYLEFITGQHARVSPPIIFRRIMPILEGVGWMACLVSACVAIYYIVIVSWISVYIINIFRGHLSVWNNCENSWNDPETCIDMLQQKNCNSESLLPGMENETFAVKQVFINGMCKDASDYANVTLLSATEQYYKNYIVKPSTGLYDFNNFNIPVLISMTCCWTITALLILKGMKIMGKISYVTVILPYFIVAVLFVRGLTLDGASEGLYFYLGKPDFSKVLHHKTWTEALKQLCFSLSVGHGGMMSMASYSKKRHNCFKDAVLIIVCDTAMSLIGGAAVFSTLGFLAKQRGVAVPNVVESGFALTFVVYPEAMTQMPAPWLWGFLFFFMLFLLGISTEMALVEVFCTALYDRHPSLRGRKPLVVGCWCFLLFSIGLIFATDAGVYWLTMYDEYSSGFSSVFAATSELLVLMYVYKASNFRKDMIEMMGEAKNSVTGALGPLSPYFTWNWRIIAPILGVVLIGLSFIRDYPFEGNSEVYPPLFDIAGWFIAFVPILQLPIFATINFFKFRNAGHPLKVLLSIQKQHASYKRIIAEMDEETRKELEDILPEEEPWTVAKKEDKDQAPTVMPVSVLDLEAQGVAQEAPNPPPNPPPNPSPNPSPGETIQI